MKNADIDKSSEVHLLIALRRKKDNENYRPMCLREIIIDETISFEVLKVKCKELGGNWRIHRTINKRDTSKALKLLQHKIIENPSRVSEYLISTWKTCLMKTEAKAERNILLDIDDMRALDEVRTRIAFHNIKIVEEAESPNGYHIVINAKNVDTRLFTEIKDVTLQRDGYIFLDKLDTKN